MVYALLEIVHILIFVVLEKKIDSKIQELGAKSVIKRHECDFDLEGWEDWAIKTFKKLSLL